jgi:hypothetical protein
VFLSFNQIHFIVEKCKLMLKSASQKCDAMIFFIEVSDEEDSPGKQ